MTTHAQLTHTSGCLCRSGILVSWLGRRSDVDQGRLVTRLGGEPPEVGRAQTRCSLVGERVEPELLECAVQHPGVDQQPDGVRLVVDQCQRRDAALAHAEPGQQHTLIAEPELLGAGQLARHVRQSELGIMSRRQQVQAFLLIAQKEVLGEGAGDGRQVGQHGLHGEHGRVADRLRGDVDAGEERHQAGLVQVVARRRWAGPLDGGSLLPRLHSAQSYARHRCRCIAGGFRCCGSTGGAQLTN